MRTLMLAHGVRTLARRLYLSVQGKSGPNKSGGHDVLVDGTATPSFLIGRDPNAQLFLSDPKIGRQHCAIVMSNGDLVLRHLSEKSQTFLNGEAVNGDRVLAPGDVLNVGGVAIVVRAERDTGTRKPLPEDLPASGDTFVDAGAERTVVAPGAATRSVQGVNVPLTASPVVIGRDDVCTLTIDDLMVSRKHTRIKGRDGGHVIEDLKSTNGTFVNGERIGEARMLKSGDVVDVGPYRFEYTGSALAAVVREKGTAIAVANLGKRVLDRVTAQPLWLLKDINLSIQPGEFVGLMGESGCGKSTFMDTINGRRPGTHGGVYHDHEDLYRNFESLKGGVGYVPQQVIFHSELPLEDALRYSSRLRLSKDISAAEAEENIQRVLETVGLQERRRLQIRDLSGGQQKRVSIAMELLSQPRTLFLDEVTSGLDMGTERKMMELFDELAGDGMTVVCITHFVDSLDIADKVAYFNKGRLCYFGPPDGMKGFFGFEKLSDIYFIESDQKETPEEMEERFLASADYRTHVNVPEDIRRKESSRAEDKETDTTSLRLGDLKEGIRGVAGIVTPFIGRPERVINLIKRPSDFKRQLNVLVRRYRQIFTLDVLNLGILVGLAPLVGILLVILAGAFDSVDPVFALPDATVSPEAAAERSEALWNNQEWVSKQITMAFGAVLTMFFLGLFASVREIVKELEVYRHERFINLQIVPYVLSKYLILAILNAVQALLILLVLDSAGAWTEGAFTHRFAILFATALAGTSMGLAISAAVPTSEWAVNLMIAVVIPQTLFAGAFVDLSGVSEWLGQLFVVSYWAVEACRSLLPEIATTSAPDGLAQFDYMLFPLVVVLLHTVVLGGASMVFLAAKDGPGVLARLARPLLAHRLNP